MVEWFSPMHCSPVTRGRPGVKWAKGRDPAPAQNILQVKIFILQVQEMFTILCWFAHKSAFTDHCALLYTVWCSLLSLVVLNSSSSDAVQSVTAGLLLVSRSVAHLTWSGQCEAARNWCNWIQKNRIAAFTQRTQHVHTYQFNHHNVENQAFILFG